MGVRGKNGKDRLRTIWTPEMDRYFISLLVEQVSKGNRFDDHLFSKRAWKNMTSLFNSKFKFPYEKDVLKNRHKTMRNLYKAVKKLLDQNGFSWDENRQMVTAESHVWDEYIKLHPDARAYRIKSIPHYKALCLIYDKESNEEKSDNAVGGSADDETIEDNQPKSVGEGDEISRVDEGFGISLSNVVIDGYASKESVDDVHLVTANVTGSSVPNRIRTYWQPQMDRYFIDLMLENMRKRNQVDGVFRKQAWMDMIASFNTKFGFNYHVDVLKNRYKTLKRQHSVIKTLLDLPGFTWDDTRQMVTADDYVWQDYIKKHTDARQFMTRPVPYFKDLSIIFIDQIFDESDTQCLAPENDPQPIKFPTASQSSPSPAASVSITEDVDVDFDHILELVNRGSKTVADEKKKRQLEIHSNSAQSKKARGNEEGMPYAMPQMTPAVTSFSDERKDESNYVTVENVIKAVQTLPDMDEDLILDACDFLEDETKAKTFMALNVKLRKKWLLRKLRPAL